MSFDNAFSSDPFGSDPFADFNHVSQAHTKQSRRPRPMGTRARSADSGLDCQDSELKTRSRRRPPSSGTVSAATKDPVSTKLELPGEQERPRRRKGGGSSSSGGSVDGERSVVSTASDDSSSDVPRLGPRRGRRMSISAPVATSPQVGGQYHHAPNEQDYGVGDSRSSMERSFSSDLDYGYGASSGGGGPAPPRRRGRRMSVGAPVAAPHPAGEVDYGYGDGGQADSYDARFGGGGNPEEEEEQQSKPQRSREKRIVGIDDIKDFKKEPSARTVGAAPRPTNIMVAPMTIPDVQRNKPRRRASMLGAVSAVGGTVVGAVGTVGAVAVAAVGVKSMGGGDEDGKGRSGNVFKNRRMSIRNLAEEEEEEIQKPTKSAERFREGSMLQRFG